MQTGATPPRATVAALTGSGRGAIAVVRVWGPDAVAVVDSAFRPNRGPRLAQTPPGRLRVGRIGEGLGDEVVAVVLDGQHADVEIQCHGGPTPLTMVVEALVQAGATRVRADDWAIASAPTRLIAEALRDLTLAPTARVAEILLEQAQGALDYEIRGILNTLRAEPIVADAALTRLLHHASVGVRLISGWKVAIGGRPNVGKSCLLNALAGFERTIVDPSPGTTRDVVTQRTAFHGWPVELADTAGIRPTDDPIECVGLTRAREVKASANLVLLVLDRSEPLTDVDLELLRGYDHALVVANKADLPAVWEAESVGALDVSARHGGGVQNLVASIAARLVLEPPPPGSAVPFRREQVTELQSALAALRRGDVSSAGACLGGLTGSEEERVAARNE